MEKQTQLTYKEQQIVELVFRFRFLDSNQIQSLLFHKSSSRVYDWLAKLLKEGYLQRHYKRTWGENRKPAIYFLDKKGARLVYANYRLTNPHLKHLNYEEKISLATSKHYLATADFYLNLRNFVRDQGHSLEYYTETDLYEVPYHKFLKSDAYFKYIAPEGIADCFLIIDLETASRSKFRNKFARYISYYENGYWKKDFKEFPTIGIVCLTEKRKEELLLDIKDQIKNHPNSYLEFKLTTAKLIQEKGIGEEIWERHDSKTLDSLL